MVGPVVGGKLVLAINPQRIDWTYGAGMQAAHDPIVTVGLVNETFKRFTNWIRRWLPDAPKLTRFAFGTALLFGVEKKETGYRLLGQFLDGIPRDPDHCSDFFYQINRPRKSKTLAESGCNLEINRSSRWFVQLRQTMRLVVGSEAHASIAEVPGSCACRLELDLNTAPIAAGDGELPMERIIELFDELVSLAEEIATLGDIA